MVFIYKILGGNDVEKEIIYIVGKIRYYGYFENYCGDFLEN